jgi:hypothetical protein
MVGAGLVGAEVTCLLTGIKFSDLSRDASEVVGFHFYVGAVSQLGILILGAAAAISLFAACVPGSGEDAPERRRFLLASAAVTGWLVLDDLLTLHEIVIPSALGLRQRYVLLIYAAGMAAFLFRFRRAIFRTEFAVLIASLASFGLSCATDALPTRFPERIHHHLEDGAKLLGITLWTAYYARTSLLHVRSGGAEGGVAAGGILKPEPFPVRRV